MMALAKILTKKKEQSTVIVKCPTNNRLIYIIWTLHKIRDTSATTATTTTNITSTTSTEQVTPTLPTTGTGQFVGSSKSNKYHYPTCRYAEKIATENLVWFTDKAAAEAAGYEPCGVCKP